jgi:hypothetical protein
VVEAFLGRSTYLHRGLPVLLGPIAMVLSAVWLTSGIPSSQEIAAAVGLATFLSWILGQLFRPLVDWTQNILKKTTPYRRLYDDMDAVYFAYCVPRSRETALHLDATLSDSKHYNKYFSECLTKEIVERTVGLMPFGVLTSTVVFFLNGPVGSAALFAVTMVGATLVAYWLGLFQVRSCFEWTTRALDDSANP